MYIFLQIRKKFDLSGPEQQWWPCYYESVRIWSNFQTLFGMEVWNETILSFLFFNINFNNNGVEASWYHPLMQTLHTCTCNNGVEASWYHPTLWCKHYIYSVYSLVSNCSTYTRFIRQCHAWLHVYTCSCFRVTEIIILVWYIVIIHTHVYSYDRAVVIFLLL